MADTVKEQTSGSTSQGRGDTLRNLSEQAASLGQTAKDQMTQASGQTTDALNQARERVSADAQDVADQIKDRVGDTIEAQKDAGANYAGRVADAMRRAAKEFEGDVPIAATYMRVAADNVNDYAERFRTGQLSDVLDGAREFARRQPTAFLGLTFLAGFGLVRLLKTSSTQTTSRNQQGQGSL